MKDWTSALEWTGHEPWGLDRVVLVTQVFTDARRRVVAHDVRTVDVVVGSGGGGGTDDRWLQNSVRNAQVKALREKVLPYLSRTETALYRRYQVVRAIGRGDDDDDNNDAFFFTSEEWSAAAFDAQRLLRCKPWHPHLLVWIWCEIVGGEDDGAEEEEEEVPEEQEVDEDEENEKEEDEDEKDNELEKHVAQQGPARMYRRRAHTVRRRAKFPQTGLTMRRCPRRLCREEK